MIKISKSRTILLKGLQITVAAIAAIITANLISLQYAPTAGIITILSIQNTKKETLLMAARRGMAFACAILIATVCFNVLGYHVGAFAVYLFFFCAVCLLFNWTAAIAMDSVLITHFMAEKCMSPQILCNEILLFVIGTSFGVLANIYLRRCRADYETLVAEVDEQIKGIIKRMSERLLWKDKSHYDSKCFEKLDYAIKETKKRAYLNWDNTLFNKDSYEINYIEMREKQVSILRNIYTSIKMIDSIPRQAEAVAAIMSEIQSDYDRNNPVTGLIEDLNRLFSEMEEEKLPESREEFESRAVLFYILKQLEEFLEIKKEFVTVQSQA